MRRWSAISSSALVATASLAIGIGSSANAQGNIDQRILDSIASIEEELSRLRDMIGNGGGGGTIGGDAEEGVAGNLVLINIPVEDPEKAASFYAQLTGKEFLRTLTDAYEGYYAVLNEDGLRLTITQKVGPWDTTKVYWAVDDIDEALQFVEEEGGVRRAGPFELEIPERIVDEYRNMYAELYGVRASRVNDSIGNAAVLSSPDDNLMGFVQFDQQAERWYDLGEGRQRQADTEEEIQMERSAAERLSEMFSGRSSDTSDRSQADDY